MTHNSRNFTALSVFESYWMISAMTSKMTPPRTQTDPHFGCKFSLTKILGLIKPFEPNSSNSGIDYNFVIEISYSKFSDIIWPYFWEYLQIWSFVENFWAKWQRLELPILDCSSGNRDVVSTWIDHSESAPTTSKHNFGGNGRGNRYCIDLSWATEWNQTQGNSTLKSTVNSVSWKNRIINLNL